MFQDDRQGSFNPSPDCQRYEEYLDLPWVVKEHQWQRFVEQDASGLVRIKKHGDMHVDAMMVADLDDVMHKGEPRSVQQLVNTASLPGIVGEAWAMADWHHGYGFPIGGVVATQVEWGDLGGSISPGGVGFDINCGVRALALDITKDDINDLARLSRRLKGRIPAGASGKGGVDIGDQDLDQLVSEGAKAAAELGYGLAEDLAHLESKGQLETDGTLSTRAKQRGLKALGTLGSGNHFLELQIVENVTNEAKELDLFEGQIVAMIHSGSRGLGHQVCTDHVRSLERTYKQRNNRFHNEEWDFTIADRQLAAAPVHSPEGEAYLDAMNAAANFAFANRSALTQRLRDGLKAELGKDGEARVLYDIGHNLAKKETHMVHGESCQCWVHRKGATKAEPGQTVLVPGDMGTASYIMKGLAGNRAFQSSCHGAGRVLSRTKAKRSIDGKALAEELAQKGVHVQANSIETLAEEAPDAYKNVDEVIAKTQAAGLAKPIARVKPMIVVKG